jgi:predicted ATP-grasp superfamily ATP-dependent carboligase
MSGRKFDNRVIVLGGDHHNTLAAIRCFGKYSYDMKVGILAFDGSNHCRVAGSKYALNSCTVLRDETKTHEWLLNEGKQLSEKGFIIPCSDMAALIIDKYYNALDQFYFVPGFHGAPGKVITLMDKFEQKKFADANGIKMAKTWEINVNDNEISSIDTYPCILKPQISAFGSKADIRVVQNESELLEVMLAYKEAGYRSVLCQQFLSKLYEACAYGYIPQGDAEPQGLIIRKIHENHGGSTAFAQIIKDESIDSEVKKISSLLQSDGYNGLYDYEFFICEDGIYLNEINFRQSGNGYVTVNLGCPSPVDWACSHINIPTESIRDFSGQYHMDDVGELIAVRHRELKVWTFVRELLQSHNCAVLNLHDIKGTISYYKSLI